MYPFESIIREFDSLANVVGTIPNNFGFGEDMTFGGNGTLWLSEASGFIAHIDAAGNLLSSFDTGQFGAGITTDGTFLYTSDGFSGPESLPSDCSTERWFPQ